MSEQTLDGEPEATQASARLNWQRVTVTGLVVIGAIAVAAAVASRSRQPRLAEWGQSMRKRMTAFYMTGGGR